jgi:hypothetical protein
MTRHVLRVIIWAAVVLTFLLVGAVWRAFRGSSRRAKKAAVFTAIAIVGLVVAYGVAREYMRKGYRASYEQELKAVGEFVEGNCDRIELFAKRLDAIRALVQKDDWLPEGEKAHHAADQPTLLLWAHLLGGEEAPDFGGASRELDLLEQMVAWAQDPGTIPETYDGQPVETLARVLDETDAPYVVIGSIDNVVRPDLKDVTFAKDGGVSGKFIPGRTTFGVAVVELETGAVVAYGRGQAASSDSVRITTAPDVLMDDLRWQTEAAALKLAKKLLGASD